MGSEVWGSKGRECYLKKQGEGEVGEEKVWERLSESELRDGKVEGVAEGK